MYFSIESLIDPKAEYRKSGPLAVVKFKSLKDDLYFAMPGHATSIIESILK